MQVLKDGYFYMTMKVVEKQPFAEYVKESLDQFYDSFGYLPSLLYVNIKDIKFLEGNRGVSYKGKNFPVDTKKTTLHKHLELHR